MTRRAVVGTGSISRDGAALAALVRGADGMYSLWTASPTSALKPYEPAPFASRSIFSTPIVRFSPDGKQILLLQNTGAGEEAWLMPYPPSAANPPHRILQGVSDFRGTPTASWMPDNRHVVLSATPSQAPRQLYLADTVSGALTAISSGTRAQNSPAVSPDGSKLVFLESADRCRRHFGGCRHRRRHISDRDSAGGADAGVGGKGIRAGVCHRSQR